MSVENSIILYVDDAQASREFYRRLLKRDCIESSDSFSLFKLNEATMLGLWNKGQVIPLLSNDAAPCAEVTFRQPDRDALLAAYDGCLSEGVKIVLEPTQAPFGLTFVALDPDGHRLRYLMRD